MRKRPSPYMLLWALLSVALIVFVAISFVYEDDELPVKRAGFREALTADREAAGRTGNETNLAGRGVDGGAGVDDMPLAETDTTVRSVLIFGDSMTILVARRLNQYGIKNGYRVYCVTWDGSSSVAWSGSDRVEEYIAEYKPDFIMVTLGSNEIFLKNFDARAPSVKKLIRKFGNIPFIWIGPPIWTDNRGFDEMMERTLPAGTYFRTDMDLKRGPDNIHPTPQSGVVWTDSIMRWMARSPHPILAERPGSETKNDNLELIYIPLKGGAAKKAPEEIIQTEEAVPATETESLEKHETIIEEQE